MNGSLNPNSDPHAKGFKRRPSQALHTWYTLIAYEQRHRNYRLLCGEQSVGEPL